MAPKKKAAGQASGAAVPLTDETHEQLTKLLADLQDTRERLMYVQPELLSETEHKQWNEEVYQVGLAISATRKALRQGINAAFSARLPAFSKSMDKLTDDLYAINEVKGRITAVAAALDVITSIVTLVS